MKKITSSKVFYAICIFSGLILWAVLMVYLPVYLGKNIPLALNKKEVLDNEELIGEPELNKYIQYLENRINKEEKQIRRKNPKGYFMVINTSKNNFRLYHANELVREGICSTGNFVKLVSNDSVSWTFKTPKGILTVKNKIVNPVWKKPDWAFIEEGLPVPSPNNPDRFEYGVLGDYAINIGNGYLIHGTLYKRQLGMPVTHGCIRLADEDLEAVYNNLQVGSKILIL